MERIGDEAADSELQGDTRLAVHLGEEDVADRGVGRVERGQRRRSQRSSVPALRIVTLLPSRSGWRKWPVIGAPFSIGSDDPMVWSTGTGNQGQFDAEFLIPVSS